MTERTFVSETSGPIMLGLSLPVGSVRVQVLDSLTTARVVLRTDDATGPAADAINRARSMQSGQAFGIEVPEMPGNVMVQSRRGNRIVQNVGTVYGSVAGVTIINGRVVSGGMNTMPTVSPIEATVCLPPHSSLAVVSQSADAEVFGYVDRMEFRSVSGSVDADGVRELRANTTSGDIHAGRVTELISAQSVSGDIEVDLYDGRGATLSTTSGDIRVQATNGAAGHVSANSVSGDVRISGARHLNVSANTVSGRVRNG
ncbi:DUF4097 family beta strand repeat-containing protein [Streptomyces sp. DH10]|uniref:DUF4097 family beta strand repeat-containing protein n=1 Tax=Streptomyces sp. DH10 TaxID=3040121 RepID=UPI00244151B2|nr:DUF4097 family beta strand repeat-containing protein [Streptomyces sp. DH10]MDG9714439.1 DUF4097 family beta strand repeat-containing protein [Streptomyces sp. DH10]